MCAKKIKISESELKYYSPRSRKHEPRQIKFRILVVCEGTKTEKFYFESIEKEYKQKILYELDTHGEGVNTVQVVDKAIELAAKDDYDAVWAVFDKDDFEADKFNAAILKAANHNIGCAWSNESFELWYLYHFKNITTPLKRTDNIRRFEKAVNESKKYQKEHPKQKYSYGKGDKDTYKNILLKYGSQESAIMWAEVQSRSFNDEKYADHNPCTMVFKLVKQLIGADKEFNNLVKKKVDSKSHLS